MTRFEAKPFTNIGINGVEAGLTEKIINSVLKLSASETFKRKCRKGNWECKSETQKRGLGQRQGHSTNWNTDSK